MAGLNCKIGWKTRLCQVGDERVNFIFGNNGPMWWMRVRYGVVIPEARLDKSMELSSLRTASGGSTLQKSSSATTKTLFCRRWRNTIAPVNWRVSNESLHFFK